MCISVTAKDFSTAANALENSTYDMAILDIMGVNGYQLLDIEEYLIDLFKSQEKNTKPHILLGNYQCEGKISSCPYNLRSIK